MLLNSACFLCVWCVPDHQQHVLVFSHKDVIEEKKDGETNIHRNTYIPAYTGEMR